MSKRLSVRNLPHQMSGEELLALFSEAGSVASARIINYLHNGQTCGFGFVAMKTQEASRNAIELLNGRVIEGRALAVREDSARSKSPYGRRGRKPSQLSADNLPGERK